jgi:hypothetical protein
MLDVARNMGRNMSRLDICVGGGGSLMLDVARNMGRNMSHWTST